MFGLDRSTKASSKLPQDGARCRTSKVGGSKLPSPPLEDQMDDQDRDVGSWGAQDAHHPARNRAHNSARRIPDDELDQPSWERSPDDDEWLDQRPDKDLCSQQLEVARNAGHHHQSLSPSERFHQDAAQSA